MKTKRFSLINCCILTMDAEDTYYPDGTIVIEGNSIVDIGPKDQVTVCDEVIDMKGRIVLPGFVNTHTHSPSPLFRGLGDDLSLMDWLNNRIWPMEKHLSPETAYSGTALTCLEFLESGITSYADQYFFSTSIAEAAQRSGLRAFIAPTVFAGPSPETVDTIQSAVDFIEKYEGRQEETLVYPCVGPHAAYSCDDSTLKQVVEIADKHDLIIHTHISESQDENREIYEKTGLTPTQYFDSLGIMDQKVLSAHSIHLNQKDMEIFRKKQVAVTYNPLSNLKLTSGIMPMKELMENEVLISIGTDGAQSNNSLDLLRDLKTGALIQKQAVNDPTFLPAKEALKIITINGAKALGMEDKIGSLEKGKLADIISLDITHANLIPLHKPHVDNIYAAVVYSASGSDVADVFVNGKLLMRNREPMGIDRVSIVAEAQEASEYILKKSKIY